jgi:hypothetical protein
MTKTANEPLKWQKEIGKSKQFFRLGTIIFSSAIFIKF